MCTWNDKNGCYLNQKHREMPFRTLANICLFVYLFIYLFVYPFIYLFICLFNFYTRSENKIYPWFPVQ